MKIFLLIVVVSLVFLAFKGESVRRYFGVSEQEALPAAAEQPADVPKAPY